MNKQNKGYTQVDNTRTVQRFKLRDKQSREVARNIVHGSLDHLNGSTSQTQMIIVIIAGSVVDVIVVIVVYSFCQPNFRLMVNCRLSVC